MQNHGHEPQSKSRKQKSLPAHALQAVKGKVHLYSLKFCLRKNCHVHMSLWQTSVQQGHTAHTTASSMSMK